MMPAPLQPFYYFSVAPRAASAPHEIQYHTQQWPALVSALLASYDYRDVSRYGSDKAAKLAGPMISPATFITGARKEKENVTGIHWLLLDFDDVTPEAYTQTLHTLESQGLAAFSHSTWSQPAATQHGLIRARVGLPTSRPCAREEWPAVYRAALRLWGATGSDSSCSDPNRFYFTPALPLGCEWAAQSWRSSGQGSVDVDALVREYGSYAVSGAPVLQPEQPGTVPIPRDAVVRLAVRLEKSGNPKNLHAGIMMRSGLDGHAMAETGSRHDAKRDVTWQLARAFPTGSPASLVSHFKLSLNLMREPGETDPEDKFLALIESAQVKILAAEAERAEATATGRARKIGLAWASIGVDGRWSPYAADELKQWEDEGGFLSDRWLVQVGGNVWLFFAGDYIGPFAVNTMATAVDQWLSPASTAGLKLYEIDEQGRRKVKGLEKLIGEYGRVCTAVEYDWTGNHSRLERSTLVLKVGAKRTELQPEYSADVAAWLALLGGEKQEALLDWIATVTWVHECAPALYLMGENGVGKGLLAAGLSRLWEARKPTALKHAIGDFNADLLRCPFVFADEKVPETWHGQPKTEELREAITLSDWTINQKNRDHVAARGAVRVLLAANNLKLVTTKEDLTREDAAALADRIVFVSPSPLARDWLESRQGVQFTKRWIEQDTIAKHALYLEACERAGTRRVTRGKRLLLPGNATELTRSIMVGSGVNWRVMSWVYSFLLDQQRHIAASTGRAFAALVRDRSVWLAPPSLLASWDHYLPNERPPTLEALTKALRSLLTPVRDVARYRPTTGAGRGQGAGRGGHVGGQITYQQLATLELSAWLRTEQGDDSDLPALLERNTEVLAAGGAGAGRGGLYGPAPGARSN